MMKVTENEGFSNDILMSFPLEINENNDVY